MTKRFSHSPTQGKPKWLFLLIAALIVVGFVQLYRDRAESPAGVFSEVTKPHQCDGFGVRQFQLTRSKEDTLEKIEFVRVDQTTPGAPASAVERKVRWQIQKPILGDADSVLAQRIVSSLCFIPRAESMAPDDAAIPEKFKASVEFFVRGDEAAEQWSFAFGSEVRNRRVVMRLQKGSSTHHFWVPAHYLQIVSAPLEMYQNRRLVNMTADSVQSFSLLEKGSEKFSLERNGSDWLLRQDGKTIKSVGDAGRKFVNRIATLRAVSVLDSNFLAAECEKLANDFTIKVEGIGQENIEKIAIQVNRESEASNVTACSSDRRSLFALHADIQKYLAIGIKDFQSPSKAHQ